MQTTKFGAKIKKGPLYIFHVIVVLGYFVIFAVGVVCPVDVVFVDFSFSPLVSCYIAYCSFYSYQVVGNVVVLHMMLLSICVVYSKFLLSYIQVVDIIVVFA